MAGYVIDIKNSSIGRKLTVPTGITFMQLGALVNISMGYSGEGVFTQKDINIAFNENIDSYDEEKIIYSINGEKNEIEFLSMDENYDKNYAMCTEATGDHENPFVISSNLKTLVFVKKESDLFGDDEEEDFSVWEDATDKEWKKLYGYVEKIEKMNPWKDFSDIDLICLPYRDDYVYVSLVGTAGMGSGISMFFGDEGLNDYFMILTAPMLGADEKYIMFSQSCIAGFWGTLAEMLPKQIERNKRIGYANRGVDKNIYFVSFEDGFFPYDLDREEVLQTTEIYEKLYDAFKRYKDGDIKVDFEKDEMYFADMENGIYEGRKCPNEGFMLREILCPEDAARMLEKAEKTDVVLEFDVIPSGMPMSTEEKPESPKLIIGIDAKEKKVIINELTMPDRITDVQAFEALAEYIDKNGKPKRIKVKNHMVEAMVSDLCRKAGIELRFVSRLAEVERMEEVLRSESGGLMK